MSNWEDVQKVIKFLKYYIDSMPMVVHKKKRGALSEFKKRLLTKRKKKKGSKKSTTLLLCREMETWKSWVDTIDIKWVQ